MAGRRASWSDVRRAFSRPELPPGPTRPGERREEYLASIRFFRRSRLMRFIVLGAAILLTIVPPVLVLATVAIWRDGSSWILPIVIPAKYHPPTILEIRLPLWAALLAGVPGAVATRASLDVVGRLRFKDRVHLIDSSTPRAAWRVVLAASVVTIVWWWNAAARDAREDDALVPLAALVTCTVLILGAMAVADAYKRWGPPSMLGTARRRRRRR